ncbi:LysR family transcriptional regulator [Roseobacteraceae bacterium NS-SX3]
MNWLEMPPLPALRAFSAFAEQGSVVAAGAALNVSHAAISQQLRALERHMGTVLLDRSGRALRLTPEGEQLAAALRLGFGAIGAAVQDISAAGGARPLHITCTPTFAALWLMPRLSDFRAAHPGIDIVLNPTGETVDLSPGGTEIALRYGDGTWPGLEAELLFAAPLAVVCAPGLVRPEEVACPADLLRHPWVEELGTTEASKWLHAHGVAGAQVRTRLQLPGNLMLQAVLEGQGVCVMVRRFAEPEIRAGRLAALFNDEHGGGYHIVTRPEGLRPAARKFTAWLRRQGAAEGAEENPRQAE